MRNFGFFAEMDQENDTRNLSMYDYVRETEDAQKEKIIGYLQKGQILLASSLYNDPVTNEPIETSTVMTDGVWAWPNDLIYLIRHHGVQISADFREHMERRNWSPPKEGELDLLSIIDELDASNWEPV
jgi:hypothetical protein